MQRGRRGQTLAERVRPKPAGRRCGAAERGTRDGGRSQRRGRSAAGARRGKASGAQESCFVRGRGNVWSGPVPRDGCGRSAGSAAAQAIQLCRLAVPCCGEEGHHPCLAGLGRRQQGGGRERRLKMVVEDAAACGEQSWQRRGGRRHGRAAQASSLSLEKPAAGRMGQSSSLVYGHCLGSISSV